MAWAVGARRCCSGDRGAFCGFAHRAQQQLVQHSLELVVGAVNAGDTELAR